MQSRFGLAHFFVFSCVALICLSACCMGLFQFLTQDRFVLARAYENAAQTYLEDSSRPGLSVDSRDFLLHLARENAVYSLSLNNGDANSWNVMALILREQHAFVLSQKASGIAKTLDPSLPLLEYPRHPGQNEWKPLLVLSHYETGPSFGP